MRIAFVASNPSHLGPESPAKKNLYKWIIKFNIKNNYSFFNVSNVVTSQNRPLRRSEFQLNRLEKDLRGVNKIVALGLTASTALELLQIPHFKLPHSSPKNRILNDKFFMEFILSRCSDFLKDDAC